MQVIGSVYRGRGVSGDFNWMIRQADYDDALFVFNDNEQQFRAHQQHAPGSGQCLPGGGNAVVRPFQCQLPRRAAGVPTGSTGGYRALDDRARAVIDDALAVIGQLVATGNYRRLFYSAAAEDPDDLGTGIFDVAPDVRRYIVSGLRRLATDT